MEFRTEYNITLSQEAGKAAVKALVGYQEAVLGTETQPGIMPEVFEIPGVLRLENLVAIETYRYIQVPNPIKEPVEEPVDIPPPVIWYTPRYEPRRAAQTEDLVLNVHFVVWQRANNL